MDPVESGAFGGALLAQPCPNAKRAQVQAKKAVDLRRLRGFRFGIAQPPVPIPSASRTSGDLLTRAVGR
jgi:hypothetical protein